MKATFLSIMLAIGALAGHAEMDDSNQMLPSYWSDSKGNCKIAFLERGTIFENKLWIYKQRNINLDTGEAELVITDGEAELKVLIGKERNGKRTMKIGREKVSCSIIPNLFVSEFTTAENPNRFLNPNHSH
jgi:hypothetical protein